MKLFEVRDVLGNDIVLTRERWNHVTKHKIGEPSRLKECVQDPLEIRRSRKDPSTALYYRGLDDGYLCVVVNVEEGFITTAYETSYMKRGEIIWSRDG